MVPRQLSLQLLIGWLPIWALYAVLIVSAHPPITVSAALWASLRAIVPAALLGLLVRRFTRRLPWPHPFRASFLLIHAGAAALYAGAWLATSTIIGVLPAMLMGREHGLPVSQGLALPFLVIGVWLYVMVAGVSYTSDASERAARAEATAARTQLAALRAQLHPHFLFNALHSVVQLIPREPARAAEAAEQIGGLLRTAIEEERDLVPLGDEWAFVSRYLDLERLRFGERLVVMATVDAAAREVLVPSFAVQTLVENAVRHGAAPEVEPTTIAVHAAVADGALTIEVRDTGSGATDDQLHGAGAGVGTGLARLRERLSALYGDAARLDLRANAPRGVLATLVVPVRRLPADDA